MVDNNNGIAWRITAVHDESQFVVGGPPARMKRVHYELEDGTNSHVVIPEKEFTTERVQTTVQKAATDLAAVVSMSGTVPYGEIANRYAAEDVQY